MGSTAAQNQWVLRVLGVVAGAAAAEVGRSVGRAASLPINLSRATAPRPIRFPSVGGRKLWQDAREAVGDQFGPLQKQLLATDDPNMHNIATQAYPAFMQRLGPSMLIAMIEADAAPPERAGVARSAALAAVAAQRALIASDPLIDLLEKNPFGVPIAIRRTLEDALGQIERSLSA